MFLRTRSLRGVDAEPLLCTLSLLDVSPHPRGGLRDLVLDSQDPYRYLEVRGVVDEIIEERALEQLDQIAHYYTGKPTYYGHIVPAENLGTRTHIICKIRPEKVVIRG